MKKILACAGVNGNKICLRSLLDVAKEKKPDGILFAGGILTPDMEASEKGKYLARFFEELGSGKYYSAVIPGPFDAPLQGFLRAGINAEVILPHIFVVHGTPTEKAEVAIGGIGGMLTESEDSGSPVIKYSHTTAEYLLRSLWRSVKPVKILLLSQHPPAKFSKEGGSPIAQEFIESFHPDICIVADFKEPRYSEKVASTLLVNPGVICNGSAAWIDRVAKKVEMIDL